MGTRDPSRTDAVRLCYSERRHRRQVIHHLASVIIVRMLYHATSTSQSTLVTWFQLGELRRWAMGLTSESGRWPDPLPMLEVGGDIRDAIVRENQDRYLGCVNAGS
jgi:hypothetical protein